MMECSICVRRGKERGNGEGAKRRIVEERGEEKRGEERTERVVCNESALRREYNDSDD